MSTPWRDDPRLAGRFHPDYPDDLQVLVHDGGPRFPPPPPELTWVRITGVDDAPPTPAGVAYRGTLLNAPHNLTSIRAGDSLLFLCPPTAPHPLLTSARYLKQRPDWRIVPCDRCGLDELFDAP